MTEEGNTPPASEEIREANKIPLLGDEKLKAFINDFLDGRVFTDRHVKGDLFASVFLLVGLGTFAEWNTKELEQIGLIYEYLSEAGPRSINGMPIFMSLKILHKEDLDRAIPVIKREQERRQNIEL